MQEPNAMKQVIFTAITIFCMQAATAQDLLQDEAQQARVHFMNEAKVSYIASADVYQSIEDPEQEPEIPRNIIASFKDKFSGARKVEWVIKEDRYKINFQLEGHEMFAYLDRHGTWMKSFTKLDLQDLPEPVNGYLESEFSSYELTKVYLKDTPDGQTFTVAAKGENEYVWLEFDESGQLLNSPAS